MDEQPVETAEQAAARELAAWQSAARRDWFQWKLSASPCNFCGEWVGHWGGSNDREVCPAIPEGMAIEEVRPNCYLLRRHRMVDAIRHACDARGVS
ncbi:MAG TPA: hypothetical protein VN201_05675 [Roseateles sp.]|nr:hypothetical protein [Roseateles sp.]